MSAELVRTAILGAGSAGRQHHAAIAAGDSCSLVGFVDPDPEARLGDVPRFDSVERLVAEAGPELIASCTPPVDRLEHARIAAEHGLALLVEKPPAASLADFDAMLKIVDGAGIVAGVMLQHRFAAPEAPEHPVAAACTVEVSRPRPADRFEGTDWRSSPEAALGGIAAHLGVHYLDLACQVLGRPESIEVAVPARTSRGIDLRAGGHVAFADGGSLAFTVTSQSSRRSERLAVLGPEDSWVLTDGALDVGQEEVRPLRPAGALRTLVYDDLAQAVRTGSGPRVAALHRTRAVLEILEAIRSAAR